METGHVTTPHDLLPYDFVVHSYTATRHVAEVFNPYTGQPVIYLPPTASAAEAYAQGKVWCTAPQTAYKRGGAAPEEERG